MECLAEPALRRRGDPGGRPLGDRGAGGSPAELMEAAGHGAGRGGGGARAAGAGADRLRQGQQRRRRAGRGPASARASGSRSRRSSLWGDERARPTSTPGWPARARSSTRSSAPASRGRRGSRRCAAIEAINRCGAPVVACDIASGVDASSGEVAGAAVEADLTVSFHAAKLGQRIAPGQVAHGRAAGGADRDPGRGAGRAGRRRDRPRGARAGAAPRRRARPSSAPARWRSPAARAA